MVTAATYGKAHLLNTPEKLTYMHDELVSLLGSRGWQLQAWAVLVNHYHFVAISGQPQGFKALIQELHSRTARELNARDGTPARQVWFQYWDSHITFQRSYWARVKYVQNNPVKHGVVARAEAYPWCSAGWFQRTATPVHRRIMETFNVGRVNVPDDF